MQKEEKQETKAKFGKQRDRKENESEKTGVVKARGAT